MTAVDATLSPNRQSGRRRRSVVRVMQTWISLLCLLPALACGQDVIARGAEAFGKSCATGYCHGPQGGSGSTAPRLAARGFTEEYISQTVRRGIPGTRMPAFEAVIPRAELIAVIAYVESLNGITPSMPPARDTEKKLPQEAADGRELFFDSVRGFNRCATCHEVDHRGTPVAAPILKIPADVAALRQIATPEIETASADGESFPALVISKGKNQMKLYDLTAPPPVLRTFPSGSVTLKQGGNWRHSGVIAAYSDQELGAILAYLRAVTGP
ncbi:MAG TPA: c-type cytochrome [Bryobacteraceae bacterium]|nr:c-type cytochrome [Bryobacteraceae bacterium]